MGSEISSSSAQQRKSREEGRHYLSPPSFSSSGVGINPPPGTPNSPLQHSQIKRKSFSHFSDFSLYPDRFNAPPPGNRMRTLSAGSDPLIPIEDDPVHPSAREIIEEEMEAAANKMKKSSTHQFAFF
eukprot:TRINITY_DN4085_c0_g1_i1.p1 TRINITY_DN4085_c0_g1~~TRINITY_DN4085_c0_g1_i1.p1  ORF type:complete len:127 (-),score=46.27 TRINITY_DN4085_c0_g1_i1:1039-1419(-)